jgi:Protein of unknown function (DUF3738)
MSSKSRRNAQLILFIVVLVLGAAVYFANKPPPPQPNDPFWVNLDYRDLLTGPTQLIARPTQYPELPEISTSWFGDRFAIRNGTLWEVLPYIYGLPFSRFIIPPPLRNLAFTRIDVLVTVPDRPREKLQAELQKQFGIRVRSVTLQTNVFLLVVETPGIAVSSTNGSDAYPIRNYVWGMEGIIGGPVIDQTGLDGVYRFSPFPPKSPRLDLQAARQAYKQALLDQLGLELIPTNMPVEFLILEHATN